MGGSSMVVQLLAIVGVDARPWYDHKIFNTLVALGLGTFIVNWLKTRWEREEKKRDRTLQFLESTGDRLNHVLSLIYNTLITHNLSVDRIEELRLRRRPVFEKRFSVRLGAETLLDSLTFSKRYDILANQIFELIEMLPRRAGGTEDERLLEEIWHKKATLAGEWPADPLGDATVRHPQVQGARSLPRCRRGPT